jgi:hypothetical protein
MMIIASGPESASLSVCGFAGYFAVFCEKSKGLGSFP